MKQFITVCIIAYVSATASKQLTYQNDPFSSPNAKVRNATLPKDDIPQDTQQEQAPGSDKCYLSGELPKKPFPRLDLYCDKFYKDNSCCLANQSELMKINSEEFMTPQCELLFKDVRQFQCLGCSP